MCGIVGGIWWDAPGMLDRDDLRRMTDAVQHRGPDGEGFYYQHYGDGSGVALGHRRLAVIDVDGGAQPIANEDGTVQVIFNGEIYNYQALRKELVARGHQFRTNSDTEVIAHLYEECGTDCFARLNGMFAIAIWDHHNQQLCLARDRLGKKPLWIWAQGEHLWFASELKSLRRVRRDAWEVDPCALDDFLQLQYIPAPRSIFRGVQKLPPAHVLTARSRVVHTHRYWEVPLPTRPGTAMRMCDPPVHQVGELLRDAVRIRMQSDVPLGAFLSGGIDSSLIVALMREYASQPIKTFSMGFAEQAYDERPFARTVATHLGTEHHEFQVNPNAVELLPLLVAQFDEPFADSSAIPTWCVALETRRLVTVALTGDGGDELFGGYDRYRAAAWAGWFDRLPRVVRRMLSARSWQGIPNGAARNSIWRKGKRLLEVATLRPAERYVQWVGIWRGAQCSELYQPSFAAQLARESHANAVLTAWRHVDFADPPAAAAYTDLCTYLPGDLLAKVDITAMAHGLECRQPFLDYRLVEAAAKLPTALKTDAWRGKRVLQHLFAGLLPAAIWRRPKMGFGIPIHAWFRGPLRSLAADTLLGNGARLTNYLRADVIRRVWDEHQAGQVDRGYHLWSLLILETWLRGER